MDYSDQLIWITGASSGIGEALAYELSKRGARLILSARNEKSLNEVRSRCLQPDKVKVAPLDLEQYTQISEQAGMILRDHGIPDILVNNGGVSQRSLAIETVLEVDKRIMDINFLGSVALTKAVLPSMLQRGRGKVVSVTSMVGKYGTPQRSSYAASKHALHGFMDSLRAEIHGSGVGVQLICPGFVQTNISLNALTGDGTKLAKMDKATSRGLPVHKFARSMANAMLRNKNEVFICGPKERFGLYLKRFLPGLFARLISRVSVT